MATTDPSDAVAQALVSHLSTELAGSATVRRGWPEHGVELDLTSAPVVTVAAGPADEEERPAESVDATDNGDGTTTVLYAYGRTSPLLQVDLWAPYRAQRDEVSALVQQALNGSGFPLRVGLSLSLDDYHGVRATLTREGPTRTEDSDETVTAGAWRRTWTIRADIELVAETTEPTRTSTKATVDVDDGTLTDEVEVTP